MTELSASTIEKLVYDSLYLKNFGKYPQNYYNDNEGHKSIPTKKYRNTSAKCTDDLVCKSEFNKIKQQLKFSEIMNRQRKNSSKTANNNFGLKKSTAFSSINFSDVIVIENSSKDSEDRSEVNVKTLQETNTINNDNSSNKHILPKTNKNSSICGILADSLQNDSKSFANLSSYLKFNESKDRKVCSEKKLWECPICFKESQGQEIVATFCGHIFCKKCIEEYCSKQKYNFQCPSCCRELSSSSYITLYDMQF